MKTSVKVLLAVVCAALLVAVSVLGTVAYLTSQDDVVNTFTVGKIAITLDESEVNEEGEVVGNDRVDANEYKLVPAHKYVKDPTVHVAADSEESYLFVKVENGIEAIEDSANTIAAQMAANGWVALDGVANVYYYNTTVSTEDADAMDVAVFTEFTVAGDIDNATLDAYAGATINVTAYAVQADGFADAAAAWTAAALA